MKDDGLPKHRTQVNIVAHTSNTSEGSYADLQFHFTDKGGMKSSVSVHDIAPEDIDPLIDSLLDARTVVQRHMRSIDKSAPGTGLFGPMTR